MENHFKRFRLIAHLRAGVSRFVINTSQSENAVNELGYLIFKLVCFLIDRLISRLNLRSGHRTGRDVLYLECHKISVQLICEPVKGFCSGLKLYGYIVSLNACPIVTVSVGNPCQLQLLDEPCIVNGIHAAAVFENPVNELAIADIVYQTGNHQIISINGSTVAHKVALSVDIPKRHNGETSRRRTIKNCFTLDVVLPDDLRVCTLVVQDSYIFIFALDVIGVTVKFVQSGAERLAIINLPEADSGFQSAVILVIQRNELRKLEYFQMVIVPKSETDTAVLRSRGAILHTLVKVLSQFVLIGFFFERHAIAQQI